jgi:hypothetical protein
MTIRYSAALPSVRNCAPKGVGRLPIVHAANDNPRDVRNDPVLRAALRHFAGHGLGAAADARNRALSAARAGDQREYSWWLAVCAKLDRRMAASLRSTAIAS